MFRHRSDIFRESIKTREYESNTPIQVLIVPKHAADDTYHEFYSMICSPILGNTLNVRKWTMNVTSNLKYAVLKFSVTYQYPQDKTHLSLCMPFRYMWEWTYSQFHTFLSRSVQGWKRGVTRPSLNPWWRSPRYGGWVRAPDQVWMFLWRKSLPVSETGDPARNLDTLSTERSHLFPAPLTKSTLCVCG
jgi:hypothetical protein